MGAKNLKAVVVQGGDRKPGFQIHDPEGLKARNAEAFEFAKGFGPFYKWGTGGALSGLYAMGALPVKNLTTNQYPEYERINGEYMRTHFQVKSRPCWKCGLAHVKELLNRIARREGYLGNLLADGVMRASRAIGGEAADWAVYTHKGASPRGHDHRGRWVELFDTCLTNTSTIESTWAGIHSSLVDLPPHNNPFSHEEVSTLTARYNGIRQFDDCLGICRLSTPHPKMVLDCFNAVTGWNWSLEDAFTVGRRVVNLLRVFNFRHGMRAEDERPSKRYGSVPGDGPAQGRDIMAKWPEMVQGYYRLMGWDEKTGKPLPETLDKLSLGELVKDL